MTSKTTTPVKSSTTLAAVIGSHPMTVTHSGATNVSLAVLDPVAVRDRMNHYRMRAGVDQSACVVVEVRLCRLAAQIDALQMLESIVRFSQSYWIHSQELGWISDRVFGIILPNATSEDGVGFAERLANVTNIPLRRIRVLTTSLEDSHSSEKHSAIRDTSPRIGLLTELFVKRTPVWKRGIDVVGSLLALMLASPLILIAAVLIRLTSQGPIFFRQMRVGIGGVPFTMYKLRTMSANAEVERDALDELNESDGLAFKMAADPRVTTVGKWLRSTSLDELPQLFNILRGDMSLVGPRPLPVADWKPKHGWHTLRHDVVPGLTCIWQVSGRNQIAFDRWMMMDIDYIRHRSLAQDVTILLKTIPAVLTRRGAV